MPVRMAITKQTASGEQFVVDVCQWNPVTGNILHKDISEMTQLADECLKLADLRASVMHQRMLEGYGLHQYCRPETWLKIQSVLDILAGNISADTVVRRWQSEIEENAELKASRSRAQDYADKLEANRLRVDNESKEWAMETNPIDPLKQYVKLTDD